VRDDAGGDVRVIFNDEVEAPIPVHACLPQVARFVVFLRPERRMMKVFEQEQNLLVESPPIAWGALL
jgi:hypothetical protein